MPLRATHSDRGSIRARCLLDQNPGTEQEADATHNFFNLLPVSDHSTGMALRRGGSPGRCSTSTCTRTSGRSTTRGSRRTSRTLARSSSGTGIQSAQTLPQRAPLAGCCKLWLCSRLRMVSCIAACLCQHVLVLSALAMLLTVVQPTLRQGSRPMCAGTSTSSRHRGGRHLIPRRAMSDTRPTVQRSIDVWATSPLCCRGFWDVDVP